MSVQLTSCTPVCCNLLKTNSTYRHLVSCAESPTVCADTGSTNMLFRQSDSTALRDIRAAPILNVTQPNGTTIQSHQSGSLHFPHLAHPFQAHIFDDADLSLSLLSVSEMCRAGCSATFTDTDVSVHYNEQLILRGDKNAHASLWHVPLPPVIYATPSVASAVTTFDPAPTAHSNDADFVRFMHAAFGSPALSTFQHAVRSHYMPSLPRLTISNVLAHPPHTLPTALGHLDQTRNNHISIQYCAPHQHRALKAERAIRTFKNHFISTLCTVAPDFPLDLWDHLLPQAELTLNHLLPLSV